ncbi:MAG: lactate dehydrogenase-like oxidoreductase [Parcubacteria group bacterium Greene0714_21]|nr:MAG: lactate dehydrogenase-like oxidoreductase [Parcubacteria group bacterium Greene0416_39]TSC97475.1 MAG: lactate dehydrogenase-like oxidoreductase [Parcubacteria group bacterium Greene1014_47]TSD04430.1 MAG: lactate dehydrogenase-like oxidoreductase [Parcubacteria group bacterium Greene0714_21]
MPKVFVTKNIPEKGIELLQKAGYEVAIGSNAKGAHAVLSLLTDHIDARFMDSIGSQLKVISNMAAGLDNVDLDVAKERGVAVRNTPDVLTESVAEHAAALILGTTRRVAEGDRFVRAGKFKGWDPALLLGIELNGKTLGIVGHGRIGCRLAGIMQKGFGMRAVYYDTARDSVKEETCGITYASFEDLLKDSDVVSLHVPLLPGTRHLIGEKELRLMKPTAYLVNTARGAIVDEKALVKALKEQWIAGAALDVFENEPKLAPGLAKLQNVILTPHIASATKETREKMAELAAQNIIAVL